VVAFLQRAQVHLSQARAEPVEQVLGGLHRRIDRRSVCDIEAEASLRQLVEHHLEFVCRASGALAGIHVLQHQAWSELAVARGLGKHVRMSHDRSRPERELSQKLGAGRAVDLAILNRRMHAHVAERKRRLGSQVRDQSRKLALGQR
jgi:hypothetical protein